MPAVVVVGIAAWAWLQMVLACVGIYAVAADLPDLTLHNFVALPFVAVGDLLNTIARRRCAALLLRVHTACVTGHDHHRCVTRI